MGSLILIRQGPSLVVKKLNKILLRQGNCIRLDSTPIILSCQIAYMNHPCKPGINNLQQPILTIADNNFFRKEVHLALLLACIVKLMGT